MGVNWSGYMWVLTGVGTCGCKLEWVHVGAGVVCGVVHCTISSSLYIIVWHQLETYLHSTNAWLLLVHTL